MARTSLLALLIFSSTAFAQDAVPQDALPLPEPPKGDAKAKHDALQKDNSLILETKGDGTKRVLVKAEVCLREGPLELFVCKKHSKEHEAILSIATDAYLIHAALLATGAKAGTPVQFVNPQTEKEEYKPATGSKIKISLYYVKNGKAVTDPAQQWITEVSTKKPMTHDWVFAGSRLVKSTVPPSADNPNPPPIYTANLGEVISVSNFRDSMLELPIKSTVDNDDLLFAANTEKIPPLGSKVWMILEPVPEKVEKK